MNRHSREFHFTESDNYIAIVVMQFLDFFSR